MLQFTLYDVTIHQYGVTVHPVVQSTLYGATVHHVRYYNPPVLYYSPLCMVLQSTLYGVTVHPVWYYEIERRYSISEDDKL